MSTMFVKPDPERPGLIVRQPDRNWRPVPADGGNVPKNAYYLRAIQRGDLVEAKPSSDASNVTKSVIEKPAKGSNE